MQASARHGLKPIALKPIARESRMRITILLAAAALLGGCARRDDAEANLGRADADSPIAADPVAVNASPQAAAKPEPATHPCLVQDSEPLRISPLKAIGTEPFWGARIEGRCVTYSHPEDQTGTRVWTRFTPGPDGGTWAGALGGGKFELRTRNAPGCSDGMSDRRYPFAVTLIVHGERRTGCAEPLVKMTGDGG